MCGPFTTKVLDTPLARPCNYIYKYILLYRYLSYLFFVFKKSTLNQIKLYGTIKNNELTVAENNEINKCLVKNDYHRLSALVNSRKFWLFRIFKTNATIIHSSN
jgi:hypothetical protein